MATRTHSLNQLQIAWAESFMRHGNGVLACRQAGYKGNAKALTVQATKNKANPAIQAHMRQRWASNCATRDELVSTLTDVVRASMEVLLEPDANGYLRIDLEAAAELGSLGLVKELREAPGKFGVTRTVKLHDKLKAAALLAQIQGWIGVETTDASDLPDEDPRDLARRHLGPDVDEDLQPPPIPDDEGAA